MPGANCAFLAALGVGKKGIALFKIPVVSASDGEHSKELKRKAHEEWLCLIMRTREMMLDLKSKSMEILSTCVSCILNQNA